MISYVLHYVCMYEVSPTLHTNDIKLNSYMMGLFQLRALEL